ncbi:MAG: TonB-dependent receptor [Bacteroidota bacterium]
MSRILVFFAPILAFPLKGKRPHQFSERHCKLSIKKFFKNNWDSPLFGRGVRGEATINHLILIGHFLLTLTVSTTLAQSDTTELPVIEVSAAQLLRYEVGHKTTEIDSITKAQFNTQRLSDLLALKTPIHFKVYGNGALATPAFRGTGANHTAVLWNGFPIASPTLGQVDFAQVPMGGNESVQVQYGAGSTVFGSGAIGGSVLLDSETPKFDKATTASIQTEFSSLRQDSPINFSQFGLRGNLKLSSQKLESRTSFYGTTSDNHFTYRHPRGYQAEQIGARFEYGGLRQSLFFKPQNDKLLAAHLWYHHSDQLLPSTIGNTSLGDPFRQENLRLVLDYKTGDWQVSGAYFQDLTDFNEGNITLTHRWMGSARYEYNFNERFFTQVGVRAIHFRADVDNYEVFQTENRLAAFALFRYDASERFTLSLNARQEFAEGFRAPFTPSLGAEWQISRQFIWKANAARTFRLPTLNERYWSPGGNPDLKPEDGYSLESGLSFQRNLKNISVSGELTAFYNYVQNWVIWQPQGGIFTPQNIQEVEAKGLEFSAEMNYKKALSLNLNYSYTRSTFASGDFEGKQLPYTPQHVGALGLNYQKGTWSVSARQQFTGVRFVTNDNIREVEAFTTLQLLVSKQFQLKGITIDLTLRTDNTLNADYQNLNNRAMPLRTYHMAIRVGF